MVPVLWKLVCAECGAIRRRHQENRRLMSIPLSTAIDNISILRIEKENHSAIWWVAVILGFLCYIIPAILVLAFWKPVEYCELSFDDSDEQDYETTVAAKIKGEVGQEFYSQIGGILSE